MRIVSARCVYDHLPSLNPLYTIGTDTLFVVVSRSKALAANERTMIAIHLQ